MRKKRGLCPFFLAACVLWLAGLPGCRKGASPEDFEWITMDENYVPKNYIEEFIKADSEEKGISPVQFRNYGRDTAILKRFRGANFARPNEAALNMAYPGIEDWMLVDIKYTTEKGQEVLRTVLYIQVGGTWRVGDSGSLMK